MVEESKKVMVQYVDTITMLNSKVAMNDNKLLAIEKLGLAMFTLEIEIKSVKSMRVRT